MIRWGAIAACLWAGAASALVVPAVPAHWGCGEGPLAAAEVALGTRENNSQDAPAGLDSDEAAGGEGATVPKFVRFDGHASGVVVFDASLAVRWGILPAHQGPATADLQAEAEQSMAADPQAGQIAHL
ncbi:MAG: hypothetical protein KJP02_09780 [Octadecabacter sp.]|nr:hypothetical protein [Octadecabacter sp.]